VKCAHCDQVESMHSTDGSCERGTLWTPVDSPVVEAKSREPSPSRQMSFVLNERETVRARDFMATHDERHGKSLAAIGGRFNFEFHVTSVGNFCTVICSCGAKQDVTDYDAV